MLPVMCKFIIIIKGSRKEYILKTPSFASMKCLYFCIADFTFALISLLSHVFVFL